MADKLTLKIVTPVRVLLDEEVDEVTAPGAVGEFTVLPDHIAFVSLLNIGGMSYRQGTRRYHLAMSGGYAEVLDNVVTVLADNAEPAEEIDVERARRARESAEKKLAGLSGYDEEFPPVEAAFQRAQARLETAARQGRA